ncbi:MAG: hypothetical protein U0905_00545 [Pirellulales bacterium]
MKPSGFGFAVAVHPKNPEMAWFVPACKDADRYPVDGQFVVTRTSDGGQSFDILRQGLPQQHAYHLVYRHALEIDSEGHWLSMGSTTGGLWASSDLGDHWQCLSQDLPPIYCLHKHSLQTHSMKRRGRRDLAHRCSGSTYQTQGP